MAEALDRGVLLCRAKYIDDGEMNPVPASIRVMLSVKQTDSDLDQACEVIKQSVESVLRAE